MEFSEPPRQSPAESVVPMINVVFLLLIFFLMTAQIAPPDPIDLDLPHAPAESELAADLALYLGQDGALAYGEARGSAALVALAQARDSLCAEAMCAADQPHLALHADRSVAARDVAVLLPQLAGIGFHTVELVTLPGGEVQ